MRRKPEWSAFDVILLVVVLIFGLVTTVTAHC